MYSDDNLIDSKEIKNLTLQFNDNLGLRFFFLGKSYADMIKTENDEDIKHFLSFIKNSKIIPFSCISRDNNPFYAHLAKLSQKGDRFFDKNLHKSISDVCTKAEMHGIIELNSTIESIEHKGFKREIVSTDLTESIPEHHSIEPMFKFYKIPESLYEIWIKEETKGTFLEIWVYHLLGNYFKSNEEIDVYHSVKVNASRSDKEETLDDLLDSSKKPFVITDIDVLLTKNDIPFCAIECKSGNSSIEDALKLYGLLKLLDIDYGILISSTFPSKLQDNEIFNDLYVISDIFKNSNIPCDITTLIENLLEK